MDGVRRWMGTNSGSSRTSRIDRAQEQKSKKPHTAAESVQDSLPDIVLRLLDPVVKEEDEYQQCVLRSRALEVPADAVGLQIHRARTRTSRDVERRDRLPQIHLHEVH